MNAVFFLITHLWLYLWPVNSIGWGKLRSLVLREQCPENNERYFYGEQGLAQSPSFIVARLQFSRLNWRQSDLSSLVSFLHCFEKFFPWLLLFCSLLKNQFMSWPSNDLIRFASIFVRCPQLVNLPLKTWNRLDFCARMSKNFEL